MKYRVISTGNPVVATKEFMDEHHPGDYELIADIPAPEATHLKTFRAPVLRDSFETMEKVKALTSTDLTVQAIARVLETSNKMIDSTDPLYQQYIQLLADDSVISQELADSYKQGIPVERIPE